MGTHLTNVLMQQSLGPKSTMPTERPAGELLLALNEFNKYELYTGTGDGVQPLFSDGSGTSNISFSINQTNANSLNGKFVYFDNDTNEWKPAYAQSEPSQDIYHTAQGFAVSLNSSGVQITTSGKLLIPFKLTDVSGQPVIIGKYYYLCQEQENAGLIQQNAPSTGIMQVVCQVIDATETSTTLLLLNDLSQTAEDVLVTTGDGSKYLGDDGQYHPMMIAGLAGRTTNCIGDYEVLDVNFNNISTGENSFGYVTSGDISVENNIASNFSQNNYIISKYLVEDYSQYSFKIKQKFSQTTNMEPIFSTTNKSSYLVVENGELKFIVNGNTFKGMLTYEADTYYYFKISYNLETGYIISVSTDDISYTNEIIIFDETNYLTGLTIYLGVILQAEESLFTSGEIDLSNSGFDYINNDEVENNYPLSNLTDKNIATITVTFKGNGIVAAGRAAGTNTLSAISAAVDTKDTTILYDGNQELLWDTKNGLTTANYSEVEYERQQDDSSAENNSIIYAKDTNLAYKYTIIYPNFLHTNLIYNKDERNLLINGDIFGNLTIDNNAVASGFSAYDYITQKTAFNTNTKLWKRVIKIQTNSNVTAEQYILGGFDTQIPGIEFSIINSKFKLMLSSNGTEYDIGNSTGTYTVLANTTYFIKIEFDGSQYTLSYSTTNDSDDAYTVDITISSSNIIFPAKQAFGCDRFFNSVNFLGKIDFSGCYDVIDGDTVWEGTKTNTTLNDVKIDFSSNNASFHPDKFLNRNGFNFSLKLDLNGNLKLSRTLNAKNYGSTQEFPFYYQVQGVEWSTFQDEGNYTQGVKICCALGNRNTGTADGTIYNSTINNGTYTDLNYGGQNLSAPGFIYYNFEKPIKFEYLTFRNYSDANHIPTQFCMHVSNDLNTWYSIMPQDATGFVKNGNFGNLPIDGYATYTNRAANAVYSVKCTMPDENEYYKYVRLGFIGPSNYRPVLSGLWIGMLYNTATNSFNNSVQTAEELIFEKQDFINKENSGINAQVVRKKVGTAYQVRFLDKLGYVNVAPEEAILDIENKKLVPNGTTIYEDERLQHESTSQVLAYQTHCKQYLLEDKMFGPNWGNNPFQKDSDAIVYSGCATTGSVQSSFNCLMTDNNYYDFANGTNVTSYVITLTNRARVGYFYLQNHPNTNYDPQTIKVYGAINGGSVEGTVSSAATEGEPTPAAVWEEIPVTKIVQAFNQGDFNKYAPTNEMNTYTMIANCTNHSNGNPTVNNYGAYNLYISTDKAYQQYKIEMQRSTNRILMSCIIPKDVWSDPFETAKDSQGQNRPLLVGLTYKPSSSETVLPDKNTITQPLYVSKYSPTTVANLYAGYNNVSWDPENSRRYVYVQQAYRYPVNMSNIHIRSSNDLAYSPNMFEYYGTNLTEYATAEISDQNSLHNWTRLSSLIDKCDIPTMISTTEVDKFVNIGRKEYGYSYFTGLFARSINNRCLIDYFVPTQYSVADYINNSDEMFNSQAIYTQEWKWTNVAGEKDEVRSGACYNHPLLQVGDTTSLQPAYVLSKTGSSLKFYTDQQGSKDSFLPDGTSVYKTSSLVGNKTLPYENRWMYKFIDSEENTWYCNTTPSQNNAVVGSYMYKNIIPKYNVEYVTGIPLTATANTGSANEFTYFASSEYDAPYAAWNAFQNLTYNAETWVSSNSSYDKATGLPTSTEQFVGFISPDPICVQGYTVGDKVSATSTPVHWEFQASNDGDTWDTLDTRKTTDMDEGTDAPINNASGTSYYFNNEKSYTHYRWVIKQIKTGLQAYARLKVWGLFVLEENPFEVKPIYTLTRTNSQGLLETAYTFNSGIAEESIANNTIVYSDIKFTNQIENVWAYEVTDESNVYWTKVAGESGSYVPETFMIYTDFDFTTENGEALVDTWRYTGNINKKFSYTGELAQDFVYDGEEPYNKYTYTGEIANQFKYTGKIEGWQYTGIQKDIYDIVPNIKLTLNRDDVRKVVKRNMVGIAYSVAYNKDQENIQYYSFTIGDSAGTIVPSNTPLYSSLEDTTPTAYADGTNAYTFDDKPSQIRYTYQYLYIRDNDAPVGSNLNGDEEVYYDADLTKQANDELIDIAEYTYTDDRETSHMHDFYHSIQEHTPVENYNFGLNFDGESYTFTIYPDGGSTNIQKYESTELLRNAYDGVDEDLKNRVAILMQQQNIIELNLTKSIYSWWSWNKLYENVIQKRQISMFRLGKIDGSRENISDIFKLYPWKVGDGSGSNIFTLSNDGRARTVDRLYISSNNMDLNELPDNVKNKMVLRQAVPVAPIVMNPSSSGTSFTSNVGAYVEVRSPGDLTLYAGSNAAVTFTSFVGAMYIPPACNVSCSTTMFYKVF